MATTSVTTVYDTFFTSTIQAFDPQLRKNFLEYWAINKLLFNDYQYKDTRGGRLLQTSAEYGLNPTTQFFDGPEAFDQEPAQTAQPLIYRWRYLGGAISVAQTELLENRGQAALWDITESRMRQLIRTMNLVLGQELYSDGTNYGGKTIVGLAAGISTTPTSDPASGAVGGLSVSSFPFWQNNALTSAGSFAANGVKGSANDYVLTMWHNCTDGNIKTPTAILSAQDVFEYYHRTLLGTVRYLDPVDNKQGDLAFRTLQYNGRPWMWDRLCPSGYMYVLNNEDVHLTVDPEYMFTWSPPLQQPYQLAYNRICGIRLTNTYMARMFSGVISGWTA